MKKIIEKITASIILITTAVYFLPIYAFADSETVYSKLNANGERYKTIVTTTEDENINQEESNNELPIETKITYKLDGKDISAEDISGKSGKVTIRIECENKSKKEVNINGTTTTMYTPFIVALGTIIDGNNNKNIKISNGGEIIENGNRTIAAGVVFPGLEESLNLTGDLSDVEIPSYLEITMDSENFETNNVLMYASPKMITDDIDWSEFDNLFDSVNELQNGIDKIENGANSLVDGTSELKDGADTLKDAISSAYNGSDEIKKQVIESIKSLEKDNSNALTDKQLESIADQASKTAEKSIESQLEIIGKSAKLQATSSINGQLDSIGKQASSTAEKTIESQLSWRKCK